MLDRAWSITDVFFLKQDAPVLLAWAVALAVLARLPLRPFGGLDPSPRRAAQIVAAIAVACAAAAWAGTFLIYRNYPLSMDEFMAHFDAVIFSRGRLFGELPAHWGGYKAALQPVFQLGTPSPLHWSSSYLPVNAAVRAAGRLVGLETLVNPAWTAAAVVATWGVARRLWPEKPQTALIAAILLATSSQVIVNGMSAYAMPAHLALNMAWLWCFLRGGRKGHAAALAVGFAASGLHQVVFHPLFVAPFILQLWLERRWRTAAFYTVGYALIGLFWISWWDMAFTLAGFDHGAGGMGAGGFAARVQALIEARKLGDIPLMARNLARFVSWQNPLAVALAVVGALAAFRAGGVLRALLLSILVTTLAVGVILPFQGHGWGYRYLHGAIGSACLLAAWTWSRLTDRLKPEEQRKAQAAFMIVTAASVLVALPVRAWQVNRFLTPYARASAVIAKTEADVVLLDDRGVWYGQDLVRNDPFLRNRPVVVLLKSVRRWPLADICTRESVAVAHRKGAIGRSPSADFEITLTPLACPAAKP